jgi:hypothetical protein
MEVKVTLRWLAVVLVLGVSVALAGEEARKCALSDGLITLTLDAAGGNVAVAKGDKTATVKGAAGAEVAVDLAALGLAAGPNDRYVGWNCAAATFLPPFISPLKLVLGAAAEQKINIRPIEPRPQLVNAMGGCVRVEWNAEKNALTGASRVPANAAYEIHITCPPAPDSWRIEAVNLADDDLKAGVVPQPWQSGPWAGVVLRSPTEREVAWTVWFKKGPAAGEQASVTNLRVTGLSHKKVELAWGGDGGFFLLRRNNEPAIGLFAQSYLDKAVQPKATVTYTVSALSWSGKANAEASLTVTVPDGPPPLPKADVLISDLTPVKATVGWGEHPRVDKSIDDNPLRISGETYDKGMGIHAISELVYDLKPEYARFVAYVGVDAEKGGSGTVTFEVYVDGQKLYDSGLVKGNDEAKEVNVALPAGAKQIRLFVGDGGDGIGADHADWAWAGFVVKK